MTFTHPSEAELAEPFTWDDLQSESHAMALSKGWWDDPHEDTFINKLFLLASEIFELGEEYRNGRKPDEIYFDENGKPLGIPIEFADILIRAGDFAARFNIPVTRARNLKKAYNATRERRHGDKKF